MSRSGATARVGLVLAALAALAWGCAPAPQETRVRFTAMGTLVDITVYDADPALAEVAAGRAERLFHALHREWDPWGEGSLGKLNETLMAGEPASPDADLAALLSQAAEISRKSDNRFDPAVGALVLLWGFSRDEAARDTPPTPAEIATALAASPPFPDTLGEDGVIRGPAGMALDLGGFAKGVAVQRAVDLLIAEGLDNVIVNAGGDLRAVGDHGDRPWRVGVREPRGPGVLAVVEISGDESVFTSGDYERFFVHDGTRYHHILDPRTGYPARGLASVTIIHPDAGLADAAATALFVAGPEAWPGVAARLGIDKVMVVKAEGDIEVTPAMAPRLDFPGEAPPDIRIRR